MTWFSIVSETTTRHSVLSKKAELGQKFFGWRGPTVNIFPVLPDGKNFVV